jgi:hypothetical protein
MQKASSISVDRDDNWWVDRGEAEDDCGHIPAGWLTLKRLLPHRLHRAAASMFGAKQRAQIFIGFPFDVLALSGSVSL